MRVKKFTAKDMPEAMKKIRAELGDSAVILNSKPAVTGGFFGLFMKKGIEVIAAIDEETAAPLRNSKRISKETKEKVAPIHGDIHQKKNIEKEMRLLKDRLASLEGSKTAETKHYPPPIKSMDELLREQGITSKIRSNLAEKLLTAWYRADVPNAALVADEARIYMEKLLTEVGMGPAEPPRKFINLIGPTGVGKTTTIAKIAAHYHLEKKQSVAFITTDTFRIAAVEQLKTYAKILEIPIETAYSLDDFQKAKELFRDKDLILVDSAGRNFQDPLYVKELQKVIDFDDGMATYLVLALTSKYQDMKNIFDQFSHIPIDQFIFTKKDETASCGALFNMIAETSVGAAYITTGQNVPDDMEKAAAERMVDWLLAGYRYE
ncbi:flagellar biosynthesis protein FlhF [Bacillus piscicola]|uniref:flagellar biosynthesis protein FlhF n=1 Tax=Bacillus piscicola TaxID=1632684 RepID=UPI001F08919D|nr:flagellar biosynthesis protein FlhF [Bacillus piscicola]